MTVKRLLEEIDSREISEWMAFFKLEKEPPEPESLSEKIIKAFKGSKYGDSR
jgi:hypothetical protein